MQWIAPSEKGLSDGVGQRLQAFANLFLEQVAIAMYLNTEIAKLNALVAKVEMAVERLLECRTASSPPPSPARWM